MISFMDFFYDLVKSLIEMFENGLDVLLARRSNKYLKNILIKLLVAV